MNRRQNQCDDDVLTIECPNDISISPYPARKRFKTSYRQIVIKNCQSFERARQLLSSDWFCKLKKQRWSGLVAIQLEIDQIDSRRIQSPDIKDFDKKSRIVLSFETKDDKIIYWKNEYSTSFEELILYKAEGLSVDLIQHVLSFFIESFKANYDVNLTNHQEKLVNLKNSKNFNLLMKAVKLKNHKIIEELLKLPFDLDHKTMKNSMAIDIAWKNKDSLTIQLLLEANSMYPSEFIVDQLPDRSKIKTLVNASAKLHNIIRDGDIDDIDGILNQYPKLIYFYDSKNKSAAAYALELKKTDFYNKLTKNDCFMKQHEIKYLKNLKLISNGPIETIRETHSNMAKPSELHISMVLAHCVTCHDDQKSSKRNQYFYKALQEINELKIFKDNGEVVEMGRILLKLVATLQDYKIYFDFNRTSVELMYPFQKSSETQGIFINKQKQIYVGAKDLLNEERMHIVIGILVHELHHLVLELAFRNEGNPYTSDDAVRKNQFDAIIEDCEQSKNNETIISRVFTYNKNQRPCELIVRPPQMMAFYKKEPNKLAELRRTFNRLFKYYEKFVGSQMLRTLIDLEKLASSDQNLSFFELTDAHKNVICQAEIEFQGFKVKLSEIVDKNNDSSIFGHLKPKELRDILNNSKSNIRIGEKLKENVDYIEREFELESRKRKFSDFNNETKRRLIYSFNDLKNEARRKQIIILSDQAGAGKSTTFEHLCVKLKAEYKNLWISYIDLKCHLAIFESSDQNCDSVEVLLKILNLTENLEIEIFKQLYQSSEVILLFDAVDEIAPNYKEFFMEMVEKIKENTNIQIWISTRPQHSEVLMEKYKQDAFKLRPWLKKQKEQLIEKVLKNNKVSYKKKDIEEIFKFSRKAISENSIRNLDNPLMLEILTEIYIKNPTTLHDMSNYKIYQHIFGTKKEIWLKRDNKIAFSESNSESRLNIWQVHQVFALKVIFNNRGFDDLNYPNFIDLSEFSIMKKWDNNQNLRTRAKWTTDSITRFGFLLDKKKNFDFSHRTFAEFFLTKFLIENIFEEEDDEVSDAEIERRIKMLVYLIRTGDSVMNLIEGYFNDSDKHFVQDNKIASVIRGEKMKKYWQVFVNSSCQDFLKFLKLFKYDENIIKALSFVGDTMIFQWYFDEHLETLLELFEFYRAHFQNNWHDFIPFKLLDSKLNGQTIYKMLEETETEFIKKYNQNELKNYEMNKRFYVFLTFISCCEVPLEELQTFFIRNFQFIFTLIVNIPLITEKLMEILKIAFSSDKDEIFVKAKTYFKFIGDDFEHFRFFTYFDITNDKFRENIKNLKAKLQEFFSPEYQLTTEQGESHSSQSAASTSFQNPNSPIRHQQMRLLN